MKIDKSTHKFYVGQLVYIENDPKLYIVKEQFVLYNVSNDMFGDKPVHNVYDVVDFNDRDLTVQVNESKLKSWTFEDLYPGSCVNVRINQDEHIIGIYESFEPKTKTITLSGFIKEDGDDLIAVVENRVFEIEDIRPATLLEYSHFQDNIEDSGYYYNSYLHKFEKISENKVKQSLDIEAMICKFEADMICSSSQKGIVPDLISIKLAKESYRKGLEDALAAIK